MSCHSMSSLFFQHFCIETAIFLRHRHQLINYRHRYYNKIPLKWENMLSLHADIFPKPNCEYDKKKSGWKISYVVIVVVFIVIGISIYLHVLYCTNICVLKVFLIHACQKQIFHALRQRISITLGYFLNIL